MAEKVIRIPISREQRLLNKHGNGYVPCEVSGRWLQFGAESELIGDKNLLFVDVMTQNDSQARKICTLCISKEDIIRALSHVKAKE